MPDTTRGAHAQLWAPVTPDDVWGILADPRSYAFWVVGSHDIHGFTDDWPSPGATFAHTQGQGPAKLSDTTTVLEAEPPHRLLLEVRVRPILAGPVELRLIAEKGGTTIHITERAARGLAGYVPDLITNPLIKLRNADALRRLAAMAWARSVARQPSHR